MFLYIKDFISRHKRKLFISGALIGGVYFASKYAKQKFIDWQERETRNFLERTKKQQYFDNTEKMCNQTIVLLSSILRENIKLQVSSEDIVNKLKEKPANKVELWNELKVLVFTKVSLCIYAGVLLVVALRIQLNIIGGYIYRNTSLPEGDLKISPSIQEKYLSHSHYFLETGIKELNSLIKEKVQLSLKDVTLNQSLTLQHVENLFWAIQTSINNDSRNPLNNMPHLLYGMPCKEKDPLINDMMSDTIELLQSAQVLDIAASCVNRGYSNIIDNVSESFLPDFMNIVRYPSTSKAECNNLIEHSHSRNTTLPFAKIIPIIDRCGNMPDESWISQFLYFDSIKTLGANIYESYSYL